MTIKLFKFFRELKFIDKIIWSAYIKKQKFEWGKVQDNGLQKEGGKEKNMIRNWKGRIGRVEEVKEMLYLGIKIQGNGDLTNHIKERMKRVNVMMK